MVVEVATEQHMESLLLPHLRLLQPWQLHPTLYAASVYTLSLMLVQLHIHSSTHLQSCLSNLV